MVSVHKRLVTWIGSFLRSGPAVQAITPKALQVSALPAFSRISEGLDGLPDHSRKFLLPAPLENEDLLAGRDEQLSKLEEVLMHWQAGHPTSVVLVGPQGCGKTSLANCFLQRQQNRNVLRSEIHERLSSETRVLEFFCRLFNIDPPVDDPETLNTLLMQAEPRIIVIEGAHNLLFRVIGGRKAAEAFLYTVLCTRQRHLWLLTCRRFPWGAMERHFNVSRYFSHIITVDPLPQGSLRQALTMRLENCCLNVAFRRSGEDSEDREPSGSAENEELENDFYHALLANSGGNFYAALYFLQLSSRYESSTKSLFLWPPDPLDMAFVKDMDRLHQLTLAELVSHGVLCPEEHSLIFRTLDVQSRMAFERLEQLKLLTPISGRDTCVEKVYDLSPVIHHAVTSALQQLNLLY